MGKTKVVQLTDEQRVELEKGYRNGRTHAFRTRCQIILLKSENRTSAEVTQILDVCEVVVNNWVRRFCQEGIKGLQTRAGRGRKAILQAETDLTQVREAVSKSRQRISTARAELQSSLTKQFSNSTLKRFLKKTIAATNELEGD